MLMGTASSMPSIVVTFLSWPFEKNVLRKWADQNLQLAGRMLWKNTARKFPRILVYQSALARSRSLSAGVAVTPRAAVFRTKIRRLLRNSLQRGSGGQVKRGDRSISLMNWRSRSCDIGSTQSLSSCLETNATENVRFVARHPLFVASSLKKNGRIDRENLRF
jgi:hypothetical protein